MSSVIERRGAVKRTCGDVDVRSELDAPWTLMRFTGGAGATAAILAGNRLHWGTHPKGEPSLQEPEAMSL
eukprot:3223519-Prymnesium_polylepis.1